MKALIWDVDGTLTDNEEVHRAAFNAAFAERGLDWHWDVPTYRWLLLVTGGRERIHHYIRERGLAPAPADALDAFVRALHLAKTDHYGRLVAGGAAVFRPGVRRLLAECRAAGVRLAIATTTSPANVTELLARNLRPEGAAWFEVIGAGDCVPHKKPAPDIYLWVLERLNLAARDCLAIEDSANGTRAARAAGLPFIITANRYTEGEDFTGALAVLADLGEPAAPARRLAGAALPGPCVDVATLRAWHAQAGDGPA